MCTIWGSKKREYFVVIFFCKKYLAFYKGLYIFMNVQIENIMQCIFGLET